MTYTDEDIERAARAWYEHLRASHPHCLSWDQTSEDYRTGVLAAMRAALATLPSPALASQAGWRVPEGYVLVPKEPTEEMISDGFDAIRMEEKWPSLLDRVYRAMLAAAPPSPAKD